MKITNMAFGLFAAASIMIVGCANNQTISEESLSLRKTSMFDESKITGDKTEYSNVSAGQSKIIDRSFENAPPMIPHSVEGMLPVQVNNNQCATCHVDSAPYDKTIPSVPKSHFTDYRPATSLAEDGRIAKEGNAVTNTSDFKTVGKELGRLSGTRFNCTLCHAPQSMATEAPKNNFKSEFREGSSATKSNLTDVINEGVK